MATSVLGLVVPARKEVEFLGLHQRMYVHGTSEVIYTPVDIGGEIPLHNHLASQLGMCASGSYLMRCAEDQTTIAPYANVCNVHPWEQHGAPGAALQPYVSLDIKRQEPEQACYEGMSGFLQAGPAEAIGAGAVARIATGPWFRILFTRLPPASSLAFAEPESEVIVIPIEGSHVAMSVTGDISCGPEDVYFAPHGTRFVIANRSADSATAVIAVLAV